MTYEWHEHDTKKINLIDSGLSLQQYRSQFYMKSLWDALFMHVRHRASEG